MLPKRYRLNLNHRFKWVASGNRIETPVAVLFVNFGDNSAPLVGISVSAKVLKRATQRNRARRLLSAAFEQLFPILKTGINIVALPKSRIIEVKSTEITRFIAEAFKKHSYLIDKQ